MRRLRSVAATSALLLLAACGQDVLTTSGAKDQQKIFTAAAASCTPVMTAAQITSDINALMAYLTPNSQSAQSKWQNVQSDLAAHDYAAAQASLANLISFINLKYGQANTTGVLINNTPIATFKANLLAGLTCYVTNHSFDINPGDPAKVFVNTDTDAGVYFPQDFVPQGFNVRLSTPSAGQLQTLLDKYASFIDIQLVDGDGNPAPPGTTFNTTNGKPIVVVCFPTDGSMPDLAKARALLGHQASTGFELLPRETVPGLLAQAVDCGATLQADATPVSRMLRKAADWLLPERAYARYFAVGGVGGSPEEFSPFGAVDPGMSVGGAGGSPEEFAPALGAAPANVGPMNSTMSGGGTKVTGTADEGAITDPAQLPKVRVTTPSGTGIAGVNVTFELLAPDADLLPMGIDNITGPNSNAALCGNAVVIDPLTQRATVTVPTASDGWAGVPCIGFGTLPGYKNLKATFDPTGVDPLACILDSNGLCATTTTSRNFLVETTAGAPASLTIVSANPQSATVGTVVAATPSVQLKDANGNGISGATVTFAVATGGGSVTGATPTTSSSGIATVGSWTLGTTAGSNTVTASATGVASVTFTATGTPGAPATVTAISAVSQNGTVGVVVSDPPAVRVQDAHGNNVPGTTVTFAVASGSGWLTGATPVTDGDGKAAVGSWTLGTGAGANSVTATVDELAPVTFNATGAAGPATNIAANSATSQTAAVNTAVTAPSVKVTDQYGNAVSGEPVTFAVGAGNGSVVPAGPTTVSTNASGIASATSWTLGTTAGSNTVTATSGTLAGSPVTFSATGTAGPATLIAIVPPPAGGAYGAGLPVFTAVSPNPTVKTTDAYGNPVSASVFWKLADASVQSGAALSATSGPSVVWTLGDGGNGLRAYLGTGVSSTYVDFTASSAAAALANLASCSAAGTTKKTDLALYSSAAGGYTGYFTYQADAKGMVRKAQLQMSVTGQSSGTGDYVTTLNVYRKNGSARGDLIATGKPNTTVLKLPGNNSSPSAIDFTLAPALSPIVNSVINAGEVMIFELKITAPSTRTFQVWYNTKPAGTCLTSKLYAPSTTVPNFTTGSFQAGLHLKASN